MKIPLINLINIEYMFNIYSIYIFNILYINILF